MWAIAKFCRSGGKVLPESSNFHSWVYRFTSANRIFGVRGRSSKTHLDESCAVMPNLTARIHQNAFKDERDQFVGSQFAGVPDFV